MVEMKVVTTVGGITELEDVPVILFCREVRGTRWILPASENPLVGLDQCRLGRLGCHIEMGHNQRCRKKVRSSLEVMS